MAMASLNSGFGVTGSGDGTMGLTREVERMRIGGESREDPSFKSMILPALYTRPKNLVNKNGQGGTPVRCLTNYIAVKTRLDFRILSISRFVRTSDRFEIRPIDVGPRTHRFVRHESGVRWYDRVSRADSFKEDPFVYQATHPITGEPVTVTVKLTKELEMDPKIMDNRERREDRATVVQ